MTTLWRTLSKEESQTFVRVLEIPVRENETITAVSLHPDGTWAVEVEEDKGQICRLFQHKGKWQRKPIRLEEANTVSGWKGDR